MGLEKVNERELLTTDEEKDAREAKGAASGGDKSNPTPEELQETAQEYTEEQQASESSSSAAAETFGSSIDPKIAAMLFVLLGEGVTELSPEKLSDVVSGFTEKITDLLAVAAVLMGVPGAESNQQYLDITSQFGSTDE